MPTKIVRRSINGAPYVLTPNAEGWRVCCNASPADRFSRSYQVVCDAKGRPLRCSCPGCVKGGLWCKHLQAVEEIVRERAEAVAQPDNGRCQWCGLRLGTTCVERTVTQEDGSRYGIIVCSRCQKAEEAPAVEPTAPPAKDCDYALQSKAGWLYVFAARGEAVTLTESYRGQPCKVVVLDRPEARQMAQGLRKLGLRTPAELAAGDL